MSKAPRMSIRDTVLVVLMLGASATAMPQPVYVGPQAPCTYAQDAYTYDAPVQVDGASFTGGTSTTGGDGDNTVAFQTEHSVEVSITVGASLGISIEKIADLSFDASVSYTTGTAVAESASDGCPAGLWTCALAITYSYYEVGGVYTPGYCSTAGASPYKVRYPAIDENENAVVHAEICACPDYAHWADAGAPARCPGDCKTA